MTPEDRRTRVAVVQSAPVGYDIDATVAKVAELTDQASQAGACLVVFPEAFVSGYPRRLDFGALVGSRSVEGRDEFRRYWASAIDVPGPTTDRLGAIAARHRTALVIGVVERQGGTLYCTVLTFSGDGILLGKHRKLMPTASERLIWGFGDGSTLTVVDTGFGRIGSVICWENYMPLLRYAMYAKGVELYCAPTVDDRPTWAPTMQHIAIEGRCFVLSSNQFALRSDYPDDYAVSEALDSQEVITDGGSCIVDPFGNFLAGPVWGEEALLTADIDLAQIPRGKFDFDVVGHYSRSDIFQLSVDETRRDAVISTRSDTSTMTGIGASRRDAEKGFSSIEQVGLGTGGERDA